MQNPKIFYDYKKSLQLFKKLNFDVKEVRSDVMLSAHIVDPLSRRYDLDYLMGRNLNLRRNLNEENGKIGKEKQISMFNEVSKKQDFVFSCEKIHFFSYLGMYYFF